MATLPLSFINVAVLNTVISARNGDGAHSYYSSGWRINDIPDAKAILPSWLYEHGNFTVVFQHTGSNKDKKFSLVLGRYRHHNQSRVSLQTENQLTCEVKEGDKVQNDKSLPLDGITMEGFHVWRFENIKNRLEVFLDGRRCVKEGYITDYPYEYTVLMGDHAADSPIFVWETHEIVRDVTKNFDPKYQYLHENMKLGVGSSVEFDGDWKEANGPSIYIEREGKPDPEKFHFNTRPGEQLFVVQVLGESFFVGSSQTFGITFFQVSPVPSNIHLTRPARKLYNVTIIFGEIE